MRKAAYVKISVEFVSTLTGEMNRNKKNTGKRPGQANIHYLSLLTAIKIDIMPIIQYHRKILHTAPIVIIPILQVYIADADLNMTN